MLPEHRCERTQDGSVIVVGGGYFMHASGRQYNEVFKVIEGELFWSRLRVEFALFLSKPRKVR